MSTASTTGSGTAEAANPAAGDELSDAARARQRAAQEAVRRRPDRRTKGLVIVHTGSGKGKTTAALGLLLRAWGRDMKVAMYSFIKHKTANFGETKAARKLGIELLGLGKGFTWLSHDVSTDAALARAGWALCRERILSGELDVVILDELTYCFKYGWLSLDEVIEVLEQRRPSMHIVITGRNAPDRLVAYADLVTEMREVKHPYMSGIKAQRGIEF